MFLARLAEAERVKAFVDKACSAWGVTRASGYKLHLIVEELFTNTVKHGHRGDCNAPVWISMRCHDDHFDLTFTDHAPPFNPVAHASSLNAESGASKHQVGGLGVLLICELARTAQYAYVFGRNSIRLTVPR
ncbi:MAG: ATP-binding protein [Betaproteobacteria bacterium]|nr:ATP-binding protein [Betaproteobacteria bacterium]